MRLYCLRHGEAHADMTHHERTLTPQGQADVERLGRYLKKLNVHFDQIHHSGVLRAEQTAKIISACFDNPISLTVTPGLEGGALVEPMADMIQHWQEDSLIVSHLPFISSLVSYLVTGQHHQTLMAFSPATMVIVERARPGVWRLLSILPPVVVL